MKRKRKIKKIPFMLIEPVKTEYRGLKAFKMHPDPRIRSLANDLEVFPVGNKRLSHFKLNPLERIPGIDLDEHIENLLGCFMAAMPVSGPLPALLLEALEKVYEIYPDPDYPPVMTDLVEAAITVLDSKNYSPETKSDIRTALEVRIGRLTHGSIGKVFQCRYSVPSFERLMTVPSVLELNRYSDEQACLLTLFILNRIRQTRKVSTVKIDRPIYYAVILEEAHVIIGRGSDAKPSEDNPDTKAYATEFVCRMLAELRAYKVCVIIIDQLPSAIAPEVIKMTGSKLALLQVDQQERQAIGGTMLLRPEELDDMARLGPGDGFLFTQGYFRARRIRTVNLHEQLDLNTELHDDELLAIIKEEEWFKQAATKRIGSELEQLKVGMDEFDVQREDIGNKVKRLLQIYALLLDQKEGSLKKQRLAAMASRVSALRKKLISSYKRFKKGPYRRFSCLITGEIDCQESDLRALAESLNRRFESVIESGTQGLLAVTEKLIKNCKLKFKETDYVTKKKN